MVLLALQEQGRQASSWCCVQQGGAAAGDERGPGRTWTPFLTPMASHAPVGMSGTRSFVSGDCASR